MTLNPFNRDTAYFQIMRDRSMMINAEDLDFQFNDLVDYLNKKIVPLVNSLNAREIPGIIGSANSFLLNIGDGTTKWVNVNTNSIADYTIPFSKFINDNFDFFDENIGAVIATGADQIFRAITPPTTENVLLSRQNNSPVWRKVETGDIQNKSITGIKIGLQSVGLEHLSPVLIGTNLAPNSILNNFILNNSITGEKLQDSSITENKIINTLLSERFGNINNNNYQLLDNSLEDRHFANSIIWGGMSSPIFQGDWMYSMQRRATETYPIRFTDDNINYTFTSDNIIDNSLTGYILRKIQTQTPTQTSYLGVQEITPSKHFANGAVENRHIKDYSVNFYRIQGSIRKEKLAPNIRAKLGI